MSLWEMPGEEMLRKISGEKSYRICADTVATNLMSRNNNSVLSQMLFTMLMLLLESVCTFNSMYIEHCILIRMVVLQCFISSQNP